MGKGQGRGDPQDEAGFVRIHVIGIKSNIPFHQAVLGNERFLKGELETHFIEKETSLIDDMKRIMEQDRSLREKMNNVADGKKRAAAIAVAAVVSSMGGTIS